MQFHKIAQNTGFKDWQVQQVVKLFQQKATVPFIARYRKEVTGGLDEVQINLVLLEFQKLAELENRKKYILEQIKSQNKCTPELEKEILKCEDILVLEDLYLPFKKSRKTKAEAARQLGLEPLAQEIYKQNSDRWKSNWESLNKTTVLNYEESLKGAREIIAEWINEDAVLRSKMRELFARNAILEVKVTRGKKESPDAQKFRDYFQYSELLKNCPSYRLMAILRGEQLGFLKLYLAPPEEDAKLLLKRNVLKGYSDATDQVKKAMYDAYERLLQPAMQTEIVGLFSDKAEADAIQVFSANVRQLLLAPPFGRKRVLAIDPGFRTGCKVVVLSELGEYLGNATIYPHEPQLEAAKSKEVILELLQKYQIEAIAVGNGTAGRETQAFLENIPEISIPVIMMNEAGASIYSASEIAREEFPDLDLTVRGAISIGRRLLDPLAELIKIDPKSIGVGQYQHDVHQGKLKQKLGQEVESAVNAVGVNLNTASKQLLSHVSGLGPALAQELIQFRKTHGAFKNRKQLLEVPKLGDKTFEQCAGFLRIPDSSNPLDNSTVHPERYLVVKRMAESVGVEVSGLIGNEVLLQKVEPQKFVNDAENLGMPTILDILKELKKPGQDIRGEIANVEFDQKVRSIQDLDIGLELNGVVTNITDFGAFVDIGVKQDGLVHISQISQQYLKHPSEAVKLGQQVKVRILDVDIARKRIQLTMKFQ